MLCALLIFGGERFPGRLTEISPWLDMQLVDREQVIERLSAQQHRRFIKTHTPLDGLPFDDRVRYVVVGRDPRDVALSSAHHRANMNGEAFMAAREAVVGIDDFTVAGAPSTDLPDDPLQHFRVWANPDAEGLQTLRYLVHHLASFWDQRHRPEIAMFHYQDLLDDPAGQITRLAEFLSIDLSDGQAEEFAAAASFQQMKRRADELAPNTDIGIWLDNKSFFHQGTSGRWRDTLDQDSLDYYDERLGALATPNLAHWLHHGWLGHPYSADAPS